jgi:hypothetical protein
MLRKAGSFTLGEIEHVRDVGPSTPATKRGLSGVEYFHKLLWLNVLLHG